jgi:exosome complex component RRP40
MQKEPVATTTGQAEGARRDDNVAMDEDASASTSLEPRQVLPGDLLAPVSAFERVVLGPGVAREEAQLLSTQAGILRWDADDCRLWVECEKKRYVAAFGDHVIGVVTKKDAEDYRIDIGAATPAALPVLAFDGATKRNRPHLAVGALVYARVVLANKHMDPEVSCAAPDGMGAKDWVTKESVFGELLDGLVFECPTGICAELLDPRCAVLQALGEVAPFELAVGANGRVWLNAEAEAMTVLGRMSILQSRGRTAAEQKQMVRQLARGVDLS